MEFLNIDVIHKECLRMLKEFIKVCDYYKLNWFLDSGSLLGYAQTGHIVPWDDDIDVIMPRDDYNKLLNIGKLAFPDDIFFQTPETDNLFAMTIHLRSNIGTCLTQQECTGSHHKGVFIDIFPLDAYPGEEEEKAVSGMLRMFDKYSDLRYSKRVELFYLMNEILTDMTERHAYSEHVADIIFSRYTRYLGVKFPRAAFDDYFIDKFEDIDVRIPIGYKYVLEGWYGKSWQTPLHKPSFHNGVYLANTDVRKTYSLDEYYVLLEQKDIQ